MEPLTFDRARSPDAEQPPAIAAGTAARAGPWLAVAVAAAAFLVLYAPIVARLVRTWWIDENYSHGFLVVPIAAYLAWRRRATLAGASRRPSNLGLPVVLGSLLLLLAGVFSAEVFLARLSMLGVAAGIVLYLRGWRHLSIIAFPLSLLLLMIPVPAILFNHVTLPLQLLASRLGEAVLALTGVPVLREGNVITLAHARLEVAEACSGIRSLVSLLTLAIVYGYFTDQRTWTRVTLVIVAVPVAILVNGLRVAGTGLLAHHFGAAAAQGFFHGFSGWLMFLAAFALLVGIQRLLLALPRSRARGTAAPEAGSSRSKTAGIVDQSPLAMGRDAGRGTADAGLRLVILAGCLFAAAGVLAARSSPDATSARRPLALLPSAFDGWQGQPGPPLDADTISALGVDDFVNRIYSLQGQQEVALYVGYYSSQREGDTIHSPLNCLPGAGWEPISRTETELTVRERPGAGPARIVVNRLLIQKGADRALVFYWYQGHGRVVANEYWGRLMLALDALRLNRTDGALVRVITPIAGNDAGGEVAAERTATSFVGSLFPLLERYLPG